MSDASERSAQKVYQPNQQEITIYLHVSGSDRWYADENGFAVVKTPDKYVYALRNSEGRLTHTSLLVGRVDPKDCGLTPAILPSPEVIREIREKAFSESPPIDSGTRPNSQASPHLVEVTQPNGMKVKLRFKGDARFNWYADSNNFTVLHIPAQWSYALRNKNGELIATDLLVGEADPSTSGLRKGIRP